MPPEEKQDVELLIIWLDIDNIATLVYPPDKMIQLTAVASGVKLAATISAGIVNKYKCLLLAQWNKQLPLTHQVHGCSAAYIMHI